MDVRYYSPFHSMGDTIAEWGGRIHEPHSGGESMVYVSTAGAGRHFWAKAIKYVCHIVNQLSSAALEKKTLIEVWSGSPATDYQNLRMFRSPAYYHV